MIKKNLMKLVVAVALTLSITFASGLSDERIDTPITSSAQASCIGGGSTTGSGGGC